MNCSALIVILTMFAHNSSSFEEYFAYTYNERSSIQFCANHDPRIHNLYTYDKSLQYTLSINQQKSFKTAAMIDYQNFKSKSAGISDERPN